MEARRLSPAKAATIALLTIFAAWQAYQFAFVVNLRMSDPQAALDRSPGDALALSSSVSRRIGEAGKYAASRQDVRDAMLSLTRNPLSRSSLRIIGANADMEGDGSRALEGMALSDRVSRRDTMAQVWLLERAAARNDAGDVMRHYDAAVSVTPQLGPLLHPILVGEMGDVRLRNAIAPYAQREARWMPGFLDRASRDADIDDLISVVEPAGRSLSGEEFEASVARSIFRVAQAGEWDRAMSVAEAVWSNFDAAEFGEAAFNDATADKRLGSLAWHVADGDGIEGRIGQGGGVEVLLRPLSRGQIARRTFPVIGGKAYELLQRVSFDGEGGARIAWRGECVRADNSGAIRVWDQTIPASGKAATYRSSITLPSECTMLSLTLDGSGPDGQRSAQVSITEFAFRAK